MAAWETGRGLQAGRPPLGNTVRGETVPVTGQGGINNTVGQERGSRRGEWGGPLRKAHPGPRDTRGHVGPGDADMGTRGAGRTQKRVRVGWGHKGRHTQRKGVGGQALELVQRASSSPHPGAAAANGWVLSWDWAGAAPPQSQAVGPGPGACADGPEARRGGWGPRAELCPRGPCHRCSCPRLRCSLLQRETRGW